MYFGWDISTSIVGVTVLDECGKWVKSSHFDFAKFSESRSLHDKMDESRWWVEEFLAPFSSGSHHHFFEERLANFAKGRTRLQTLMRLAGFNALFSYEVWRIHREICPYEKGGVGILSTHIHPSTVKAVMKREGLVIPKGGDKKKITLDFVRSTVPGWEVFLNRNENPHPFNFDRADSYITARAGFLRRYVLSNAKGKKATASSSGIEAARSEPG